MKTERTTPSRHADRVGYDRQAAYRVLDEASVCHLGFVVDGAPRVLPTLFARVDDTLYVHGSTGGGPALAARAQSTMCLTVTLLDGWVLGRSQFHHSVNFRSVVVYAVPRLVRNEAEQRVALSALVDRVAAGRSADSRPPTAKELAGTAVLALAIEEFSVKARQGGPADDPADLALPYWSGVLPLRVTTGTPEPDPSCTVPLPGYLAAPSSPR